MLNYNSQTSISSRNVDDKETSIDKSRFDLNVSDLKFKKESMIKHKVIGLN